MVGNIRFLGLLGNITCIKGRSAFSHILLSIVFIIIFITCIFLCPYGHATALEVKPQLAYVVDNVNSTVNVIDLDTCMVVTTIPGIKDPSGIAISPDNRRLYVTDASWNATTVIDTSTYRQIAWIHTGYEPTSVAVSPDGSTAYVTNLWDKTVSVIDTAENKVIGTLKAGTNPSNVAINPKTGDVYVSNHLDGTVSVYRNNTSVVTIQVGEEAGESAVTPDGSRLYVASPNDHYVSIIDTATDQVVDKYVIDKDSFPMDVEISPDGKYAYVATLNGPPEGRHGVDVVSVSDNRLLRDYSFDYPEAIAVSPDGQAIVIVSTSKSGTGIIQSSNGEMKAQLSNTGINVVTSKNVMSSVPSSLVYTTTPGATAGVEVTMTATVAPEVPGVETPIVLSSMDIVLIAVICLLLVVVIIGAGLVLYFGYMKK